MIATFFRVAVRVPIEMKLVIDFFFFRFLMFFFSTSNVRVIKPLFLCY